jgi:hypothetical protein
VGSGRARVSSRPCRVPISSGAISEELDRSVGALLCFSCPAKLSASTSRIYCVSHGRPRDHPPVAAWYTGPGGTRNPPGPRLPGKPANPATARDPFAPVLEAARDARAKVSSPSSAWRGRRGGGFWTLALLRALQCLTRVLDFVSCRSGTDGVNSVGARDAADCRLARETRHV